jgi:hypothetical protein
MRKLTSDKTHLTDSDPDPTVLNRMIGQLLEPGALVWRNFTRDGEGAFALIGASRPFEHADFDTGGYRYGDDHA